MLAFTPGFEFFTLYVLELLLLCDFEVTRSTGVYSLRQQVQRPGTTESNMMLAGAVVWWWRWWCFCDVGIHPRKHNLCLSYEEQTKVRYLSLTFNCVSGFSRTYSGSCLLLCGFEGTPPTEVYPLPRAGSRIRDYGN